MSNAVIVDVDHKILKAITIEDSEIDQVCEWLNIDSPRAYPVPGGDLLITPYTPTQIELIVSQKNRGFNFLGRNYPQNAIFYITPEKLKSILHRNLTIDGVTADINKIIYNWLEEIKFYNGNYDPEFDESVDTSDF